MKRVSDAQCIRSSAKPGGRKGGSAYTAKARRIMRGKSAETRSHKVDHARTAKETMKAIRELHARGGVVDVFGRSRSEDH